MTNGPEKSDPSTVARKPANNPGQSGAESVERREGAKGNSDRQRTHRTPSRESVSSGLLRVRERARRYKKERFTALLHHVTVDLLRTAFLSLKRKAAPGVDDVTWPQYEQNLEVNLVELHGRVHRGAYRALPSRRTFIPKEDGTQRPLGIASLEDKIVQRAVVEVLNAIYEEDFLGFSYGFRPGRSQHDALDALATGITRTKVNWILDCDIRSYFDSVSHDWLVRFIEHRIGDPRIIRLIRKWLKAGVLDDGKWSTTDSGTPQWAVISPLLSNCYLHYTFDLWVKQWRDRYAHGVVVIVRYADDSVVGFEHEDDARRFLTTSIRIDPEVARSEAASGFRNAALANYLRSFENLNHPVEEVLGTYFHQCAIAMSCQQLARAGLFLAYGGRNVFTGRMVVSSQRVRRINALMLVCVSLTVSRMLANTSIALVAAVGN
jgi:RNA-directed DNA polymerase